MCPFVCTVIYSAPGNGTVLRPVSLEWVEPEGVQREKFFPKSDQWPNCAKKKFMPLMLFYGENDIFYMFFRSFSY